MYKDGYLLFQAKNIVFLTCDENIKVRDISYNICRYMISATDVCLHIHICLHEREIYIYKYKQYIYTYINM